MTGDSAARASPVPPLHRLGPLDALVMWARRSASLGRTVVIGVAGPPGAGKSTTAALWAQQISDGGFPAVVAPMDGFHFSADVLRERGLAHRKGAPDTFDVEALKGALAAVREPHRAAVPWPTYDRERHDVVAHGMSVPPQAAVVIVEGNYLLLKDEPWAGIGAYLDEAWFLDVPWEVTRQRLIDRRVATGREADAAVAWVDSVDRDNDAVVRATRAGADRVVTGEQLPQPGAGAERPE
ncbi:nucleoside/nucleotide kinase family protein [Demequina sp. B12]|uniref:nucleoside/nucleotide kinase family protein n=1 Tax=Demequina sp. B12 TaxID=2992757 RepID=UPI00237C50DB|nr:nucleoside/nucleotide kinase family protein [Demequina sp. B12]MDE0572762.1 nucleoside/nucleotide kinase family protein [Demequina sp. B12]